MSASESEQEQQHHNNNNGDGDASAADNNSANNNDSKTNSKKAIPRKSIKFVKPERNSPLAPVPPAADERPPKCNLSGPLWLSAAGSRRRERRRAC
jgi:hypothetical protein